MCTSYRLELQPYTYGSRSPGLADRISVRSGPKTGSKIEHVFDFLYELYSYPFIPFRARTSVNNILIPYSSEPTEPIIL